MTTHRFNPQPYTYKNTFGSHEPVLRVADGDTIVTTTVDARGVDASGETVAGRPNPQTGPFFIDGAEPGDALVVHFDRLSLSRDTGWTSQVLASNVVDPEVAASLPNEPVVTWTIDRDAGTTRLAEPMQGLGDLSLSVDPMLGSFGVAPKGGQAISTFTSAEHGGNMDYRGFREGVTVYLPVFVDGALFHLGDGHAVQGDGEINGTGVETSLEVEFTVHVRKGWTIGWPRGEDDASVFTTGNARPLDQALQHATSEMLAWLQADWGLDIREASTLMGQVVQYDIGNVYDPAYTVVCKMPKVVLASLPGAPAEHRS